MDFLLVANSNFDLRYRSGSLQAYDLEQTVARLRAHCGTRPGDERASCGIVPIEDERDDLSEDILAVGGLLRSEVLVGSFVDGMALAPSPAGVRIYMPIRSDGDLTHVDLAPDGTLACGDDAPSNVFGGTRHECTDEFRTAEDGAAREDGLEVPTDPIGITAGARPGGDGNYVVMAHRGGRLSLLWEPTAGARPELVDVLDGFPTELVDLAPDPVTGTFWVPAAFETVVPRAGLALEPSRQDSFVFRPSDLIIAGVDYGGVTADTRAVRFDPRPSVRRAYVLSRRPSTVWVVDVDDSVGSLAVRSRIPVGFGASRLEVEDFPVEGRTLAFVTNFDSRDLYVIDVDLERLVGIVRNVGGPFELTVDVARRLVYIADFRSSVVRVVDLSPMFECLDGTMDGDGVRGECSPRALGFIGRPRAVQELI